MNATPTSAHVDAIVVGAGIVGLAVARALARSGRETIVLEAETLLGAHASSRNSEVIHAGLYYPPGSLKARCCVDGKHRLYRYCQDRDVGHRRTGKLVVATTSEQIETLHRIQANARKSGVDDVELWDAARVATVEPDVRARAALWSPSTGIIDSHGLMRALRADAEDAGAMLALGNALSSARAGRGGLQVTAGDVVVDCDVLVDAAGLKAQRVARSIEGLDPATIPPLHLAKGTYFTLSGRVPFRHLIYPVPDDASLGIHVTLDLSGQARFGPDQEWVEEIDYSVDPKRVAAFYPAIRAYWPDLPDNALQPGYAGIRAKVQAPGAPMADFVVHGPDDHGVEGLCCLYGIESPGLTACLALADVVLDRLGIRGR